MPKPKMKQIKDFLSLKRLAFVGISRDPKDYTRLLFNEFKQRGYTIIPVNPNAAEIEGEPCFQSVEEIKPEPDGVLIFTRSTPPAEIAMGCIQSGIKNVWIRNGEREIHGFNELQELCAINKINLIQGYCPFMFLKGTQFPHKAHGFFLRLAGSYPGK